MKHLAYLFSLFPALVFNMAHADKVKRVTNCNDMSKNPAVYQQSLFCEASYQYYQKLQIYLHSLYPDATIKGQFIFYEHLSEEPEYAGIDYDQTQIACDAPEIRQISVNRKGEDIYPDNYPNAYFTQGLGSPLCNFLAYIGSIETTSAWPETKAPMDYFRKIIAQPLLFGLSAGGFDPFVKNLSADGTAYFKRLYTLKNVLYSPSPLASVTFSQAYFNANKDNPYSAYWGMSAGGGSGAGFQIYRDTDNNKNVVFTGGFGGGGGFTSPEFNSSDTGGHLSDITQIAIGTGGGGGLQLSSGIGLGAGTSSNENKVEYTYYNQNKESNTYDSHVTHSFVSGVTALKEDLSTHNIIVKGGGGMGVGAEYLYLADNGQSGEVELQEYLPHVISTGAGFTFAFTIENKSSRDLSPLSAPVNFITANDENFYAALGKYYNEGEKLALKKANHNYACAVFMCQFTRNYVLEKAAAVFGKANIPNWLTINQCNFAKYNPDPKSCPKIN